MQNSSAICARGSCFVGAKMLVAGFYKIPTLTSLLVIVGLLAAAVVASLIHAKRRPRPAEVGVPAEANAP